MQRVADRCNQRQMTCESKLVFDVGAGADFAPVRVESYFGLDSVSSGRPANGPHLTGLLALLLLAGGRGVDLRPNRCCSELND